MDYCDSAAHEVAFRAAQGFHITGAGIMLVAGFVLLAALSARRRRVSRVRFFSSGFGILATMCGFGSSSWCPDPRGRSVRRDDTSRTRSAVLWVPQRRAGARPPERGCSRRETDRPEFVAARAATCANTAAPCRWPPLMCDG
ncbi:MYXO-CTERM sorting domain-containing protein [Nocardia niwae]|uniref:MYXO-CTERM sorting domain-containing protein n=1 Tax=Nocardia niwae TaxID=626084 RepID=A0ABV2X3U4_9NOCA